MNCVVCGRPRVVGGVCGGCGRSWQEDVRDGTDFVLDEVVSGGGQELASGENSSDVGEKSSVVDFRSMKKAELLEWLDGVGYEVSGRPKKSELVELCGQVYEGLDG